MAFRWRTGTGQILVIFGSTHQLKKKRSQSRTPSEKLSGSAHVQYTHVQYTYLGVKHITFQIKLYRRLLLYCKFGNFREGFIFEKLRKFRENKTFANWRENSVVY